jgi:hypothetical protein
MHGPNDSLKKAVESLFTGKRKQVKPKFLLAAGELLIKYKIFKQPFAEMKSFNDWFADNSKVLLNWNIDSMRGSSKAHRLIVENKECSTCFCDDEKIWFSSTAHCKHAFCKGCWLNYCRGEKDDNPSVQCPEKDCVLFLPPSLFFALAMESIHSDEEIEIIKGAFTLTQLRHQKNREACLYQISGFKNCPQCEDGLIIDSANSDPRFVTCACGDKLLVDPLADKDSIDGLVAAAVFTKPLGKCSRCGSLVEKIEGCSQINCRSCGWATTWIPLEVK